MVHEVNFAAAKIIANARCKTTSELIEAWASDKNAVNKNIDLVLACVSSTIVFSDVHRTLCRDAPIGLIDNLRIHRAETGEPVPGPQFSPAAFDSAARTAHAHSLTASAYTAYDSGIHHNIKAPSRLLIKCKSPICTTITPFN
ncbi:unnamed protein product [Schistocephalus solidus]|uniref:Uncharacterized protein n=1 Tax=Schistocephalus solidus TaxID=70667 RepID=A0A183SV41_SCHSO|nr:unnamed protein product [Schistocephalus solidus]